MGETDGISTQVVSRRQMSHFYQPVTRLVDGSIVGMPVERGQGEAQRAQLRTLWDLCPETSARIIEHNVIRCIINP